MYLSRIQIDMKKYETMRALYNLEVLHGMIENTFSGERQRNLWRLDQMSGNTYLLMVSPQPPQNSRLVEQIGMKNSNWETKSYEALFDRISSGSSWHFRLVANPTKSIFEKNSVRGKVRAITIVSEQREWLKKQGKRNGFELIESGYDVVQTEWKTFKKNGRETQVISATFEGVLSVTNKEQFCHALTCGIGREKAYGMGLLTVVPYE